jgi:F-type H+-transporting ATPase subunit b
VNLNLTMLGQAIALGIFVWFCMKYVWPPIIKTLADREARIADGLAAGEHGRREQELAERRAKDLLREAKQRALEMEAKAQHRAGEIVEEGRSAGKVEGERQIAAARAAIEQETHEAREKLRGQVAALAVAGAEQILMREVDQAKHKEALSALSSRL